MCWSLLIGLLMGGPVLNVFAVESQLLTVEITDTILLDDPANFAWGENAGYMLVVPEEDVSYDRESGMLSWEISDSAYNGPLCLGDMYTALIGNISEPGKWVSSINIYAMQEFHAPVGSKYSVHGGICLDDPLDIPAVIIIQGIGAAELAATLQGGHPDYVLTTHGRPVHLGLSSGYWRTAEILEFTPLGEGWYRYYAVIEKSQVNPSEEDLLVRGKSWALITFYDCDGWAVLQVYQPCDDGIILNDEPLTGVVFSERELAGFQVYTSYNYISY